jgi:hypothetical protein
MIDLLLLAAVLAASAATGLLVLRAVHALPADAADHLRTGTLVGLGVLGAATLALAACGSLRPGALAVLAAVAVVAGARDVRRAVAAVDRAGIRRAAPLVALAAVVLLIEVVPAFAPPVGGDQTKYQLVYPRLYAAEGGLVATPWSFWGQMQFLPNFVFAAAFALRGDVLARLLNVAFGVLAALAVAALVRRHLARNLGAVAGTLFFTLPITWSLMTRAGADLPVIAYAALAMTAFLDWSRQGTTSALQLTAVAAGLAGASKTMGLLVPALVGLAIVALAIRRAWPAAGIARTVLAYGLTALVFASPYYVRNALETGNPLYPFGYRVFGGRDWSAAASDYLADYYREYQTAHATRRSGTPYAGLQGLRFPWDLTMYPGSFENAARQAYDIGPFMLAFAPGLVLVRRRRPAVLATAALGAGYLVVIAGFAWAHPRYVIPGVVLLLAATVPAARDLLGRRAFLTVALLTVAGNLALSSRLLQPLWADQARVAVGRLAPDAFLRRHSPRFAFWERANAAVPADGKVLVLEKIPHPYYIERDFVLGSYLEQGMIDYRQVTTVDALADVARDLGITHVAVDVAGLAATDDAYEAAVGRLWRAFVSSECTEVLREGDYALFALRDATAYACAGEASRG